ncbi:amino acid adenylation domain-containing protein [Solidesulfovibrio magneticus]|nr:amino acid adenylation domain-containing protein [Solidesulfovibrio magneticus]
MMGNIAAGFFRLAEHFLDRDALDVQGQRVSYGALRDDALAIAGAVAAHAGSRPHVAVFDQRSRSAYAAVLGILAAGRAYVPLNPGFPAQRTRHMLIRSGCAAVVTSAEHLPALAALLDHPEAEAALDELTVILAPEEGGPASLAPGLSPKLARGPRLVRAGSSPATAVAEVEKGQTAYLLFTSGSTGAPKGVAVSHGNVGAYLDYVASRYAPCPEDRFSQLFDLTFDLSVHDMFVCFGAGACLCVPAAASLMAPGRFIRDKGLTVWFSTPSTAAFMARLGMLKPDAFPGLRLSLFCGEPLPAATAAAWSRAAPHSRLENLYGPTETTIAIAHYAWDPAVSPGQCQNGLTPIGRVFANHDRVVVGPDGAPAKPGQAGELLLAGVQVTRGYLDDEARTAGQFVRCGDDGRIWYRTGDIVREDQDGILQYLARTDQQVKIRGFRVELSEVEHAVRSFCQAPYVVAVPWPLHQGNPEGLILAVFGGDKSQDEIINHCKNRLPGYMVPARVDFLETVPLNSNGKIDRAAVKQLLTGI